MLNALSRLVSQDCATTAALLAHIVEVDARKLYLPAGYPSMYAYCVGELRLSEEAAFKRIRVARLAREFPAIFPMLADGRLHLSAAVVLNSYLTAANAEELLMAAAHRSRADLERLLAERFPQLALASGLVALPPSAGDEQLSPGDSWTLRDRRRTVPGDSWGGRGRADADSCRTAQARAGRSAALRVPGRHRPEHARPVALRPGPARASSSKWRPVSGAAAGAAAGRTPAREGEVRGHR